MASLERAVWIGQEPRGNQKCAGKIASTEVSKTNGNFGRGFAGGKNTGQSAQRSRKSGKIGAGKTASGFGRPRNATMEGSSGLLSAARCHLRFHRSCWCH